MNFINIQQDPWQASAGDLPAVVARPKTATPETPATPRAPAAHALFTLQDWLKQRAAWPAQQPVGIAVPNDAELDALLSDLPRVAMIALHFPKWTDGRAYSQARLLRTRHRFAGEIRATGEVLVDMVPLLLRTGFDAALLRADQNLQAAERALSFFKAHYQSDALAAEPIFSPARQARWARAGGEPAAAVQGSGS